jgi:hypothetical protein
MITCETVRYSQFVYAQRKVLNLRQAAMDGVGSRVVEVVEARGFLP